jgi:hypothetical protein
MIPLTESLYVPAKLADNERVLLNIGTGYYVQVSTDAASDYCRRRTAKLEGLLKDVNQVGCGQPGRGQRLAGSPCVAPWWTAKNRTNSCAST